MTILNLLLTPRYFAKHAAFLAIFIGISILLFAQEKTPYHIESLKGKSIKDAEITTSGGSIEVVNEPGGNYRLEVYVRGNNGRELSKTEIEQRLSEKYELKIDISNTTIKAYAKAQSGIKDWKNALSISFKLYVPEKMNTNLKTSGGSITLGGLNGKQQFATSGGSLTVKNMKGDVDGRTSGGSISLLGSEGNIKLATSGGSITATDSKGEIELRTSGGSLKLDNISGQINATTSGGSVSGSGIKGTLKTGTSGGSVRLSNISASLDAYTTGGSIDVSMVSLGEYVKLRNSAGSINLKIPAGKGANLELRGMGVSVPNLTNFSGNSDKNSLDGTINGGGVAVSAKSSAGRVTLSFQ